MKTEEDFKAHLKVELRKQRQSTTVIFAMLSATCLAAMIFAFFKSASVEKTRNELLVATIEIKQLKTQLSTQTDVAEKNKQEAVRQNKLLEEALVQVADCKKLNKGK